MTIPWGLHGAVRLGAVLSVLCAHGAVAQPAAPGKPAATRAAAKPAPRVAAPVPAAPASAPTDSAAPPALAGKGWRVADRPSWVVELSAGSGDAPRPAVASAGVTTRRELLVDQQSNFRSSTPQRYLRVRSQVGDASTVAQLSQVQILFNPAYQSVELHELSVIREGRRTSRLRESRIELLRREQQLEQLTIQGIQTLLVVPPDIRAGDAIEVAYSVIGQNPIFEGRILVDAPLASAVPLDRLSIRLLVRSGATVQTRVLGADVAVRREPRAEGDEIWVERSAVDAQAPEQGVPPWARWFPSFHASGFADWAEVDAWAQRLFLSEPAVDPAFARQLAVFRSSGLTGEALAAEVLRFVQDEIRYFSVSLALSSHRPKPPARTLADRFGDCKDKVVLLNALLGELGFDVRPALVSTLHQRGVADFPASGALFDHVVSRLQLGGQTYYLDATLAGQGLALASRGQLPYGTALVVGEGQLQAVPVPPAAIDRLAFTQHWDLSRPGAPAEMEATFRAYGIQAERWRELRGAEGEDRIGDRFAAQYASLWPALEAAGPAAISDDRAGNVFEVRRRFRLADVGPYERGIVELTLASAELLDLLVGPPEAARRLPYLYYPPARVESRVTLVAPAAFPPAAQAPIEVGDRHLRYTARVEVQGNRVELHRQFERRSDEVPPGSLASFRQTLLKARENTVGRARVPLVAPPARLTADEVAAVFRSLGVKAARNDTVGQAQFRHASGRMLDSKVLSTLAAAGPLQARVLASRAAWSLQLDDHAAAIADVEAASALAPAALDPEAMRELKVRAWIGAGELAKAYPELQLMVEGPRCAFALRWLVPLELLLGRVAAAESFARALAEGDEAQAPLSRLWLFVTAERSVRGGGKAALAPHLAGVDAKTMPGALLHFLSDGIDADALVKVARARPETEREYLASASFFVAQRHQLEGRDDEARKWYQRTLATEALDSPTLVLARLELARLGGSAR